MRELTRVLVAAVGAAMLGAGSPAVLSGQEQPPRLVYPPSDPSRDIAAALAAARKDGTHVLLDFGADWCPDCRVLGARLEDPEVAPFVAKNFKIVHIDVGHRDKNTDVVAKYKATSEDWIPAVVVLDAGGNTIAITDSTTRITRRTTAQELLARLQEWAPKTRWLELASVTERGVRVTLALEQDSEARAWLAATFAPVDRDTHIYSKDLPSGGVNGLGRPTRLAVVSSTGLTMAGAVVADRPASDDRVDVLQTTLSVYPPGAVTLRAPVTIADVRSGARAEVSVGYMACGPKGCLPPVVDKRIAIAVPGRR
jgi:thiol-disulfide isomerase/thioredoxin